MYPYTLALQAIGNAYTGRGLRNTLYSMFGIAPACSTDMYLRGESAEYIARAALVCMQGAGE